MIITGTEGTPGINGGLIKRTAEITGDAIVAYVCTIDVPSVDEYADKIVANGGAIVVPKMPIPGVAWLVYAKDTEENIFGDPPRGRVGRLISRNRLLSDCH